MTCLQLVNSNIHCVYAHKRLSTGHVFYIGKGSGNRPNSKSKRNKYWQNIVSKDGGFNCEIIASGLTEKEAYFFERLLITKVKEQTDIKLTNLIDGGKGGSFNPSDEVRAKQRNAKIGRSLTEEHKEKIRQANFLRLYKKGYKQNLTDEQRKNKSDATRRQVWTDERKANIAKAKLGHVVSEETKRKISDSKRGKAWTINRINAQMKRI